jgi:hypothetical protein
MSQATAVRTAPRPVGRSAPRPGPAAPRLRVVSAPAHTRSRAGLVLGCITLLGGGLVALLLLNVSLEKGSYELQEQQSQATQLQDRAQSLREQLATLQAPQNLAAQAGRLGMVPNPNAAFLRASDGKVLGVPTRAVAPMAPSVTPAPGTTGAAANGGTTATGTTTAKKPASTTGGVKKPGPAPTPTH